MMERDSNVEKALLAELAKPQSDLVDRVTSHNQILLHNFQNASERQCPCQLLGCEQSFSVTLIPNQILYPKYCDEHRNSYRRQNFLRILAEQSSVYKFEKVFLLDPSK